MHNEQELLDGLALGRHTATNTVYRQHFPTIMHWICNNGGSEPEAADLFQEAMVVLFQKSQSDDFRLTCKIGTYLFAIAKNLWYRRVDQLRKGPVRLPDHREGEDENDWKYEEDLNIHQERELHFELLGTAMDAIGEPCRSLLKAFYHEGKSMQDIAASFGYTNPDNAKTQKYKCLTRLKKIFFSNQVK